MGQGRWPRRTVHCGGLGWTGDTFWSWSPSSVDLGAACYHLLWPGIVFARPIRKTSCWERAILGQVFQVLHIEGMAEILWARVA